MKKEILLNSLLFIICTIFLGNYLHGQDNITNALRNALENTQYHFDNNINTKTQSGYHISTSVSNDTLALPSPPHSVEQTHKKNINNLKPGLEQDIAKEITVTPAKNKNTGFHVNGNGTITKGKLDSDLDTLTNGQFNTDDIVFDFPNVSLVVFAKFIADLNRKVLIGENLLQGNVSIKTPHKLSLKEVMDVFKNLLNSRGLDYVVTENDLEVIQKSDATVAVYNLNYLKSEDVAKAMSQVFRVSFESSGRPENIQITSLESANSLMVLAPKERQLQIQNSLKKLDIRRRQVLLDMKIVELTKNGNFDLSFDYKGGGVYAGSNGGDGSTTFLDSTSPVFGVKKRWGNFQLNVRAMQGINQLKILAQPRILAAENQQAQIKVQNHYPYSSATTALATTSNPTTTATVDYQDIGIDLQVTPRINVNRDVSLDLNMDISSLVQTIIIVAANGTIPQTSAPEIGHRIIKNSATVMDGDTLTIGGLLENKKTTKKNSVPIIGDIPFLGFLFSNTSEETEQTELIVFITPTVIADGKEGNIATQKQAEQVYQYDPATKDIINPMLKGKKTKRDDPFNLFNYFTDGKYMQEQELIPQIPKKEEK